MALAEFMEYGEAYAKDTVANAKPSLQRSPAKGSMSCRKQGLHRLPPGANTARRIGFGAGAKAAKRLEEAGIITNMNMLPGDALALSPSGLRLGVQELTRVGFTPDDMQEVARCYARVLLAHEGPKGRS